jgi:hypothetical protein
MPPILLFGALAGLALLLVKSASKPTSPEPPAPKPPAPEPPMPEPPAPESKEEARTSIILQTKQVLKPGEKLPYYEVPLVGGLGVFSTKKGGPARLRHQANPLYPWKFAPEPGETPLAFTKSLVGNPSRFVELVGMPALRLTFSKKHPSGIDELRFETVGALSPTADGKGWLLLKRGDEDATPWVPPAKAEDKLAVMLPPSWRTEITEQRGTRQSSPSTFVVDDGLEPVLAESK